MSKQTALQWFKEMVELNHGHVPHDIYKQALQMEREQIEKSYTSGREQWQKYEWDNSNYESDVEIPTPRKYYNETYGGKDK